MKLNMICLKLHPSPLYRWGTAHRLSRNLDYLVHAATRGIFGEIGPQPYLVERERSRVLGYTAADGEAFLTALGNVTDPDLRASFSLQKVFIRPMPSLWKCGATYTYAVRCRPEVRVSIYRVSGAGDFRHGELRRAGLNKRDAKRRVIESDVWLHRTWTAWKEEGCAGDLCSYRKAHADGQIPCYCDWLRAQFDGAAQVDAHVTRQLSTSIVARGGASHGGAPRYSKCRSHPDVTFQGTLTVTDPERFAYLLARGIGRCRALGFGMLLLRRPCNPA